MIDVVDIFVGRKIMGFFDFLKKKKEEAPAEMAAPVEEVAPVVEEPMAPVMEEPAPAEEPVVEEPAL